MFFWHALAIGDPVAVQRARGDPGYTMPVFGRDRRHGSEMVFSAPGAASRRRARWLLLWHEMSQFQAALAR